MDVKEAIETYKNIKEYKSLYAIIDTDFFLNFAETVLSELAKKDKIIDEMAGFIEVFELDEEITKTYCGETIKKCKHIDEDGCSSCIKEYFTRKCEGN